jgi:DNA polymerase elongation subunit (family B)
MTEEYYEINVNETNGSKIIEFINKHDTVITFNGDEFDIPIMKNNNLFNKKFMTNLDLKLILHTDKTDFKFKARGPLMGYKFRKQSMKETAKVMELETMKGSIDYMIFKKDSWDERETEEIKKYLRGDIEVTKQMFDKIFDFWSVFTEFISEKNIKNWSWISARIAALVYKSACYEMGWDEEYGEKGEFEDGGGKVLLPRIPECRKSWYVDFTSLYPNIYIQFDLVNETSPMDYNAWHGNEVFKVEGYYSSSGQHKLTKSLLFKLKERIRLKKEDPNNPLIYAFKIFLNTFYGVSRSSVFKKVHTPNAGKDCCYLGRQINDVTESELIKKGYNVFYADTDSCFINYPGGKKTSEEVKKDLKDIVEYIKKYVPYPADTFNIDIEREMDYVMFVPDEKTGEYKKKNYMYVYFDKKSNKKKIKIMGLPIKKNNATELGPLIFEKYIKPRILEENKGKFPADWINSLIVQEVKENIELMAQEYNPSPYSTYTLAGKKSLSAQISYQYLDEKGGFIKLIKNKRIGKVGKGFKYCSIEEAKKANLSYFDLDLTKVYNELAPFTEGKIGKVKTKGFFGESGGTSVGMKLKAKGYF